ncbi:MAG: hypothetical protein RSA66_10450 [Muribaculaceae bacterium]
MKRKNTVARFRLPYTDKQVYAMLLAACRAEVANRCREFKGEDSYKKHIWDIAKWLTSDSSTFGLFLCGGAGNGKTTILRALHSLINYLRSDESYSSTSSPNPIKGFLIVSAKELVLLAKARNNPSRDNTEEVNRYKRLRNSEILAIDDLGTEPRESVHYGDFVTAAMDMIAHRYEEQFCTIVSSNLAAPDIAKYYDERIADRFREMMHIVDFGMEQSFRELKQ